MFVESRKLSREGPMLGILYTLTLKSGLFAVGGEGGGEDSTP